MNASRNWVDLTGSVQFACRERTGIHASPAARGWSVTSSRWRHRRSSAAIGQSVGQFQTLSTESQDPVATAAPSSVTPRQLTRLSCPANTPVQRAIRAHTTYSENCAKRSLHGPTPKRIAMSCFMRTCDCSIFRTFQRSAHFFRINWHFRRQF